MKCKSVQQYCVQIFGGMTPTPPTPAQITIPKESTIKMKMTVYSPAGEAVAIQKDKGITAKPRDLIKFAQSGQIMVKAERRDNNLCQKT